MDVLLASTAEAFRLLFSGNPEIWEIVGISFRVSTMAILAAVPFALVLLSRWLTVVFREGVS
jgi:tungstate transport system permease protein